MAKKKKKEEGSPGWVTTMSDMNTLLLTFFVMLVSMLSLEKPKFSRLTAALHLAGKKFKPSEGRTATPTIQIKPTKAVKTAESQTSTTEILNLEGSDVEMTKTGDGVRYSFSASELGFEEGQWELTAVQKKALDELAKLSLLGMVGTMYVYGNCDVGAGDAAYFDGKKLVPPRADDHAEKAAGGKELLSLLRATAVQKYLSDVKRDNYTREDRILPVGLSDRLPRFANPANDDERAVNRRIEVLIIDRKK